MTFTEKNLRALPATLTGGRHVKWYLVDRPEFPVDAELLAGAERYLPNLYPDFEDDTEHPVTFAVVHRGAAGLYLNAYNWAWDNVIHCRTAASGEQPFLGSHGEDLTDFTELTKNLIGCVWELPPLEHERSAWVRHMLVPARADLAGYLADTLADGPVGL